MRDRTLLSKRNKRTKPCSWEAHFQKNLVDPDYYNPERRRDPLQSTLNGQRYAINRSGRTGPSKLD